MSIELLSVTRLDAIKTRQNSNKTLWFINKGQGFRRVSYDAMVCAALANPVKTCLITKVSETHIRNFCCATKEK